MSGRHARIQGWLPLFFVIAMASCTTEPARPSPSASGEPSDVSLRRAVDEGRLSPQLVDDLRTKGEAVGIVSFRGDALIERLLAGPDAAEVEEGLDAISGLLERIKDRTFGVLGDEIELGTPLRYLPTAIVTFRSVGALEVVVDAPVVKGVSAPVEMGLTLEESLPLVHAPEAHAAGYRGAGTYVAILDTGVDYTRGAFGSCGSPGEGCSVVYSSDVAPDDESKDDDGHGTNVAGIVAGVAPSVGILMYDVFRKTRLAPSIECLVLECNLTETRYEVSALNDVVKKISQGWPIRAVNMSLGRGETYYSDSCSENPKDEGGPNPLVDIFQELRLAGAIPVLSAGNDGRPDGSGKAPTGIGFPACTPGAVSVGAVYDGADSANLESCDELGSADELTCFTQTGPTLSIFAPGMMIKAAGITMAGTSQAAPHVAGAIALLWAADPEADADRIQRALETSGPLIHDPRSGGRHRLDVEAALVALGVIGGQADAEPPRVGQPTAVSGADGESIAFTWSGTDAAGVGIRSYRVFLSTDAEPWMAVMPDEPTATNLTIEASEGHTYQLAVQAEDAAGNLSEWAYSEVYEF